MNKKIIKYIKRHLKIRIDIDLTDQQIKKFLEKPRTWYHGLSINEFLVLNPKVNEHIVLENLRQMYYGEIMET